MRVLIVEDDPNLSFLWTETLEGQGFICDAVSSTDEAVEAMYGTEYDIAVLDLFVKDGSTLGLSDLIGARHPGTPIVMLTGSHLFATGEHTEAAKNVDWFLRKPVRPGELVEMVRYLIASAKKPVPPANPMPVHVTT